MACFGRSLDSPCTLALLVGFQFAFVLYFSLGGFKGLVSVLVHTTEPEFDYSRPHDVYTNLSHLGVPPPPPRNSGTGPPATGPPLRDCQIPSPLLVGPVSVHLSSPLSLEEIKQRNPLVLPGGRYRPPDCEPRHHTAIVVPYRNRQTHLRALLYHLHPFLQRQQIHYSIYIVQQWGNGTFNRAKLLNVGVREALRDEDWSCIFLHDVDLLPENDHNTYTASLISLSNNNGRNVELKFVDSIRRQFEFSVDSFQIVLDSMLAYYELAQTPMSQAFHPTVSGESMYGDFNMALSHLRNKLIATKRPEEIRGGGLLKYCNLLVREFRPASEEEFKALERYMCSRFFIDFPDISEQQRKVEAYLQSHFIGEEKSKYDYLMILRRVVNESTVCLMGHERRQTLHLISLMAFRVLAEQNAIPDASCVTCYYQPAPYVRDHNFSNYYVANQNIPTWLPCN